MMEGGLLTLVSVVVNALAAVFAPILARRMTRQEERLASAEEALELVGTGLCVVERAVEENKRLAPGGAGDRIAKTIRSYGPAARTLVDAARSTAHELRMSAIEAYEEERKTAATAKTTAN